MKSRKRTPMQRRAAFGRALAKRVRKGEVSKIGARKILRDFGEALGQTERGVNNVTRAAVRAFNRISPPQPRA